MGLVGTGQSIYSGEEEACLWRDALRRVDEREWESSARQALSTISRN